jgi:hypothetical protein
MVPAEREIDRIVNTPCSLAEREQQIAKLEEEIDRLQRTEEAIAVATDASVRNDGLGREPCSPGPFGGLNRRIAL